MPQCFDCILMDKNYIIRHNFFPLNLPSELVMLLFFFSVRDIIRHMVRPGISSSMRGISESSRICGKENSIISQKKHFKTTRFRTFLHQQATNILHLISSLSSTVSLHLGPWNNRSTTLGNPSEPMRWAMNGLMLRPA